MDISLKNLIAPSFYDVHKDVKSGLHTHYFLKGGRGSCKSSFVSIEIILGLLADPQANAVCYMQYHEHIRDSVYKQIKWAINVLGVDSAFKCTVSPLKIEYIKTGQCIYFKGLDDAQKSKGIKLDKGYFKFLWFEEADMFSGMEELRKVIQSIIRNDSNTIVFYTYNPPKTVNNWINTEVQVKRDDRLIHHSCYIDVPKEWLGTQFISEAEYLKEQNETVYNHEYLGEVVGTGGNIFNNVTLRTIDNAELESFEKIYRGLDFGFSTDPSSYTVCAYHNHKLYIFYEYYACGASYDVLYDEIKKENKSNDIIIADSAEPRSIYELCQRRLKVVPTRKYKDSVRHGIMWLQGLREIIIDSERCPNVAREFVNYEYERDKNDVVKADYPDKDNHTIDSVRYACNNILMTKKHEKKEPKHYDFKFQEPKANVFGVGADPTKILR